MRFAVPAFSVVKAQAVCYSSKPMGYKPHSMFRRRESFKGLRLLLSALFLLVHLASGMSLCLCAWSTGGGKPAACHPAACCEECAPCDQAGLVAAGHDCHHLTFGALQPVERVTPGSPELRGLLLGLDVMPHVAGLPAARPKMDIGPRHAGPPDGLALVRTTHILC